MQIKNLIYCFILVVLFFSCSEDNDVVVPRNLQEYVDLKSNRDLDKVIAFAASANSSLSYIYYYPIQGATEVRYYETESTNVDENDFINYRRKILTIEDAFGEKLKRISRSDSEESWCIVTYLTAGKLHKSNPIRLKNTSKPTEWSDVVTIDPSQTLEPKFTWTDGIYTDSTIYFQVISKADDDFISGTYTEEKTFQFYDLTNVVLDINEGIVPDDLVLDTEYNFTMMGVSEDNWVNLVIQKPFTVE